MESKLSLKTLEFVNKSLFNLKYYNEQVLEPKLQVFMKLTKQFKNQS